jgi:hypothetical protein
MERDFNYRPEAGAISNPGTMAFARAQSSFINRVYGWMCGGLPYRVNFNVGGFS